MTRFYSNDGKTYAFPCGRENGKAVFEMHYENGIIAYETHEITFYKWAQGLHGNAPSGTPYAYFRASKNGKRIIMA